MWNTGPLEVGLIQATFVNFEVWSMLSVLWLFYSLLLLYVQAKQSFTYPKCRLYLVSWPEMVWQPMRKKGQNGFFYQPKCKNQRLLSNLTHSDYNITHTLLFKLSLSRYILKWHFLSKTSRFTSAIFCCISCKFPVSMAFHILN